MKHLKVYALTLITFAVFTIISCSKSHSNGNGGTEWNGQLPYSTDFNNNADQWQTGNLGSSTTATIQNGYYTITNNGSDTIYSDAPYNFFGGTTGDIAIQSSMKITANGSSASDGYGGFSFDYFDTTGQFLVFGIHSNGTYDVWGRPDAASKNIIYQPATASSAIKPNDFNTLQIKLSNGAYYFYINGTNVYSLSEPFDDELDIVSFFANRSSTVQVDNFTAQ